MLADDIAAALPELRAHAESRMKRPCAARPVLGVTADPETGADVIEYGPAIYEGPCRLRNRAKGSLGATRESGGVSVTLSDIEWHIPFDSPRVPVGTIVFFDASEVRVFADEMSSAGNVHTTLRPIVTKGALNIKKEWNDTFRGSKHFRGVAGSVNYDVVAGNLAIEAEIGPDRDSYPGIPGRGKTSPAAPLAGIATFGGARGGGGSVADPQDFLDAEGPRFEKALEAVMDRLLP